MKKVTIPILLAGGVFFLAGLPYKMDETHTVIETKKIQKPFSLCVLADLHCREFGKDQSKIVRVVNKNRPNAILIPGDLFDVDRDYELSFKLLDELKEYPLFYVTGNHETYLKKDIHGLKQRMIDMGVTVLENESLVLNNGVDRIELCGLEDLGRKPVITANTINSLFHSNAYRILMSHRPEKVNLYKDVNCDLIVSGHAHGGQWKLPFTKKGAYAPSQGFLPKYTEGLYDLGNNVLFVSRGLASGNPHIPRLYNNPEIAFLDFKPKA